MNIRPGYTFDDVLLIPKHSDISSRNDIDLSVDLGKNIKLSIPIVSANMKSITDIEMAKAISYMGGLAILHRFYEETIRQEDIFQKLINFDKSKINYVGCSVGIKAHDYNLVDTLVNRGCNIICVDVAHGFSEKVGEITEWIAKKYPEILLIAGNVATGSGASFLYNAGADIIKTGIGGGCFVAGTRVLMADASYKNIENIVPGDRVINKNGDIVTVIKSFSTGIKKIIKLRNSIFYQDTYVTPDHSYFVADINDITNVKCGYGTIFKRKKAKNKRFKWKKIVETNKDFLLIPSQIKFDIPNTFTINLEDGNILTPSYDLGYVFGTYLGDGSNDDRLFWNFGINENDIIIKLKTAIANIITNSKTTDYIKSTKNVHIVYEPNKHLSNLLKSFGKRTNKFLPKEYIINNKQYLQGIIDGLIDSDGFITEEIKHNNLVIRSKRISIANTSPKIIELFNISYYLVNGIFPNNEKLKPTIGYLKNANIENCNELYKATPLNTGKTRVLKDFQFSKILEKSSIELEMPVYDIEVDCETHSFIANNAIVHNSLCTTRIETGNGVPQFTALENVFEASKNSDGSRKFKIIADGGIRQAGDLVKGLCFSDAIMLGNLLAGTDECPGKVLYIDGKGYKEYAGSSTHKTNHIEGVSALVPLKGPVKVIIEKLMEGVRSGLSYQGATNLDKLKESPEFISISHAGLIESHPHDVMVK